MGYARSLFLLAHRYAAEYMSGVAERTVTPSAEAVEALRNFDEPMPDGPAAPLATLEKLHRFGSPATIAQTGGRYFGFVNGGVIPEALASRWLIDAWDQNTALEVMSPVGSRLEHVCEQWLVDLLGLPKETAAGFTNGTSAALLCCLTAARHALLAGQGWEINKQGLYGPRESESWRAITHTQLFCVPCRSLAWERIPWSVSRPMIRAGSFHRACPNWTTARSCSVRPGM